MDKRDKAPRIFVSYANSDREFAARLARSLTERGARAFDPLAELKPGDDWGEALLAQLRASDTFVFVVPEREGAGKNALFELGAAHALGKRIVAVVPTTTRFYNADVARVLSGSAVLDASTVPQDALADAIMMPLAA